MNNLVVGVTQGYEKAHGDPRRRLPGAGQGAGTSSSPSATATRCWSKAPEGITFKVESPTKFSVSRESTSRRSARSPPTSVGCVTGPLQGQGHPLRRRTFRRKAGKAVNDQDRDGPASGTARPTIHPRRRSPARRSFRVRKKNSGTRSVRAWRKLRPRAHLRQLIDDLAGHTLAVATSLRRTISGAEGEQERKAAVGGRSRPGPWRPASTRWRLTAASKHYHGRMAALAQAAREAGLEL